ncbi:tetratricopeptide repeat protein [Luteirhabdus pelagi]|uniref:tetratricopeptide repeat protein n=1 Tax=Luteirhabdus pelagi TaxID=2792783 RepID=UPI0019399C72|nr:tetratricopeptide repeat protein [Luteirhabdus pelagi]
MKNITLLLILFSTSNIMAQPNCESFKYYGDMIKYEACQKAMEIKGHYQFSKEYQTILDKAIAIDPTYDYPYWAKSVAYLKSGDFVTWKKLIDKAVELNPIGHLGYRGWCRYQFFRDYKGSIEDIEKLDSLVDYDIGHSQNGTYHLNIAKGLCYKGIGEREKAIGILEKQIDLNEKQDFIGAYDYLHLGVLYYETEKFEKAIEMFTKQAETNDLAENHYYLALTYRELDRLTEYKSSLKTAKERYLDGKKMSDPYSNPMDKIYLEDIESELKNG